MTDRSSWAVGRSILMALIDARGTVLDKDQLMSLVWPGRVVEENNLPAQIAVLRKVFGADRHLIRTVARRGYQFTGEIRSTPASSAGPSSPSRMTNLPEAVSELIGREAELEEVVALVAEHRLVSLVGAGGIGHGEGADRARGTFQRMRQRAGVPGKRGNLADQPGGLRRKHRQHLALEAAVAERHAVEMREIDRTIIGSERR